MTVAYGPICQIAWVTEDIEATEQLLSKQFGVGGWVRMPNIEFGPHTCRLHGEPADFTAHISLSYSGDMQLELIQPVRGDSIYTEFLARSGPGLHHVCFEPGDFDAAVASAQEQGLPIVQEGEMSGGLMRFAYMDGASAGVPYIELGKFSPEIRAMFEHIKTAAKGA
ncbi:lactoylglutathione lyase [Mycolicibacterium mucogenicum]|uniref:Lactoylglutathione lyase n=1 Tax=Mycolicibacterium mucogenicum TaxID=56689 RepID=A0A1A3GWZ6_MYCMU|nr:VOC family protein [Mycolicibacterium mucogenicum]OBJ40567.1 lactoylglutathione lyase [Mycolicibacterium mucogenicum]